MTAGANRGTTLQIRRVLRSIGSVIRAHFLTLGLMAVILHFVAWEFVGELQGSLANYTARWLGLDLAGLARELLDSWSEALTSETDGEDVLVEGLRSGNLVFGLAYLVLMQVAVITLMFRTAASAQGEGIGSARVRQSLIERFRSTDVFFDVLRTLGILMALTLASLGAYLAFTLATVLFEHEALHALHSVTLIRALFLLLIALGLFLVVVTIEVRWALAVPMTIVENTSVVESLRGSWRLTSSCWFRIVILSVLLPWPFELVVTLLPPDGGGSPWMSVTGWVCTLLAATLTATLYSVCYSHLRTVGGNGVDPQAAG